MEKSSIRHFPSRRATLGLDSGAAVLRQSLLESKYDFAMPIYEYECKKCHHRFEKIQKFSDPHVKKCPECGGPIEQVVTAPAVQFKGSGWYVTDYAKKSGTAGSSSSSPSSGETSNGDGAKSETSSTSDTKESKKEKPKAEASSKKAEKK
jgi:putative FmdB family regulatory protein